MANVKISQLPSASAITGDDLLPIVENGAVQTQKAEFSQVLSYVTSSTFDTLTVTELTSSYLSGSEVQFGSATIGQLTASNIYSETTATLNSDVASTGTSETFVVNSLNSLSSQDKLLSLKNNSSEKAYVRHDGYVFTNSSYTVGNNIYFQSDGVYGFTTPLKIRGNGSGANPAVRIGNRNNSTTDKALTVSMNLDGTPTDLVDFYGNGDTDIGGTLVADVEVSGNIAAASYTLSAADRGKTLLFSSSATQDITCSSGLDVGYNVTVIQAGTGQLNFSGSGVTLVNRFGHTSSAGQYSAVSVIVLNGTQYLVVGDTA